MQSLRQFDKTVDEEKGILFDFDDPAWYDWLYSEGFEHITQRTEDSYGFLQRYPDERYNAFLRNNYWYWCKCFNHFIIRIYVFRNCVVVDKDWDCGGNVGGRVFEFELWTMDEIWDQIIDYIKLNIQL